MTLVHPDQGFSDRALRFPINPYFCCHQATDIVYCSGGYQHACGEIPRTKLQIPILPEPLPLAF